MTLVAARYPAAVVAAEMEVHSQKMPRWSETELRIMAELLPILPVEQISERLGRSVNGIKVIQVRRKVPVKSKQPGWLTGQQVANLFSTDVHQVCAWTDRGLLPYRLVPGRRKIRAIRYVTLLRWAVNPLNWIYFKRSVDDPGRILDPRLRRLIERQKARWRDEWWTPGQVAAWHGVEHTDVNRLIRRGEIAAVRWGNWWVLRSEATRPGLEFYKGKGSASYRLVYAWNERADAFLRQCRERGVTWEGIARMMKMKPAKIQNRYGWLKKQDGQSVLCVPEVR